MNRIQEGEYQVFDPETGFEHLAYTMESGPDIRIRVGLARDPKDYLKSGLFAKTPNSELGIPANVDVIKEFATPGIIGSIARSLSVVGAPVANAAASAAATIASSAANLVASDIPMASQALYEQGEEISPRILRGDSMAASYLSAKAAPEEKEKYDILKDYLNNVVERESTSKEIRDTLRLRAAKTREAVAEYLGVEPGLSADIGGAIGSSMYSMGLQLLGGPMAVGGAFATSEFAEAYGERREAGKSVGDSFARAAGHATLNGLIESYATKSVLANVSERGFFRAFGKNFITGGIEEALQTGERAIFMNDVERKTAKEIFAEILYDGLFLGGIGEGVGGGLTARAGLSLENAEKRKRNIEAFRAARENAIAEAKGEAPAPGPFPGGRTWLSDSARAAYMERMRGSGMDEARSSEVIRRAEAEAADTARIEKDIIYTINANNDPVQYPEYSEKKAMSVLVEIGKEAVEEVRRDYDIRPLVLANMRNVGEVQAEAVAAIAQAAYMREAEDLGTTPAALFSNDNLKIEVGGRFGEAANAGAPAANAATGSRVQALATGTDGYAFNERDELVAPDGRVLFQREELENPKIEVSSSKFADVLGNMKALTKRVKALFQEKFSGKSFINKNDGHEIKVESFHKARHSTSAEKLIATEILDQILENGRFVRSLPDGGKHPDVKEWRYYSLPVGIDGKARMVEFSVRVMKNGDWYYNHIVRDSASETDPSTSSGESEADGMIINDTAENVNKFYSRGRTGEVRGYVDMAENLIRVFEGGDVDTILHELVGHWFSQNRIRHLIELKREAELRPLMEHYGAKSAAELLGTEIQERIAKDAIAYFHSGEAPSAGLRRYFEQFRRWLEKIWQVLRARGLVNSENVAPEVREFFDDMLANQVKEQVDLRRIRERREKVKKFIRAAVAGEKADIGGVPLEDVRRMVEAATRRLPAKPKNLAQAIGAAGGIEAKFAAAFDMDIAPGLVRENGVIKDEARLREFMVEKDFMPIDDALDAADAARQDERMAAALENPENAYAGRDMEKLLLRENAEEARDEAERLMSEIDVDPVEAAHALAAASRLDGPSVSGEAVRQLRAELERERREADRLAERALSAEVELDYRKKRYAEAKSRMRERVEGMAESRKRAFDDARLRLKEQNARLEEMRKELYRRALEAAGGDAEIQAGLFKRINAVKAFKSMAEIMSDIQVRSFVLKSRQYQQAQTERVEKLVKSTKPYYGGEQKFDYPLNRAAKEWRRILALPRYKAAQEFGRIPSEVADWAEGRNIERGFDHMEMLRVRLLAWRAGSALGPKLADELARAYPSATEEGMEELFERQMEKLGHVPSLEMVDALVSAMEEAIKAGKEAKNEADLEKATRLGQDIEQVKNGILKSKSGKKSAFYARSLGNWWSTLNQLAGKDVADKYNYVPLEAETQIKSTEKIDAAVEEGRKIYGLKSKALWYDVVQDLSVPIEGANLAAKPGAPNGQAEKNLSKWQIMDLYNDYKNRGNIESMDYYYGAGQLEALFSRLSPEDRKFADAMMASVQDQRPAVNAVWVKVKGIDMNEVKDYWPRTSYHSDVGADILDDYNLRGDEAQFTKSRNKFTQIKPVSAWGKYRDHIMSSEYMINQGLKYLDIRSVFGSAELRSLIKNKLGGSDGEAMLKHIDDMVASMSLKGLRSVSSAMDGVLAKFTTNIAGMKVSLSPASLLTQLTSMTNYMDSMPAGAWAKDYAAGLLHPKKTAEFMRAELGDFLENRYEGGYNEFMQAIMRSSEDGAKGALMSPAARWRKNKFLSALTRKGDIWAIVYGGYPYYKFLLSSGMSKEQARTAFIDATLRSQQAATPSSLSLFQQRRDTLHRVANMYQNNPVQYMRKMSDAIIAYRNGDMPAAEMWKNILNYGVLQPALYVAVRGIILKYIYSFAKHAIGSGGDDDDDPSLGADILQEMVLNPLSGFPYVRDFARFAASRARGRYAPEGVSVIGLSDFYRALRKIGKIARLEADAIDWMDFATPLVEGFMQVPLGSITNVARNIIE